LFFLLDFFSILYQVRPLNRNIFYFCIPHHDRRNDFSTSSFYAGSHDSHVHAIEGSMYLKGEKERLHSMSS
jgi:hypothetical protein